MLSLQHVKFINSAQKYEKGARNKNVLFKNYRSMRTYDVFFNSDTSSDNKGFNSSYEYCLNWIQVNNGTDHSYFADYKGGTVSIVCNETGETVYEDSVR